MTNEEIFDELEHRGATVRNGILWYPYYYRFAQIRCARRGKEPIVRWDGRGAHPNEKESQELVALHALLGQLRKAEHPIIPGKRESSE